MFEIQGSADEARSPVFELSRVMTGDNYRQRATIFPKCVAPLPTRAGFFFVCFFFVQRCSSARGGTVGTMLTVTACQIGQNMRSRGGCTEVLLIVSSPSPSVRTHMFLGASAGSLFRSRRSRHLHISQRVQGRDIGRLPPSRLNVSINCFYSGFLQAFSAPSSCSSGLCAMPNL